ncbi:MAG: hypothetical protein H6741_33180 [Alphaproteobacteria bacterium]|nr:hypothetical protein [Alphaproteobacteria bacterium]
MPPSAWLLLALHPSCRTGLQPFDTAPEDSAPVEADSDTDSDADSDADSDTDSDADSDAPLDYPEQRVGAFYLTWHAYAAQAMAQEDERLTVEQVIRGEAPGFASMLWDRGLYNAAGAFHYHQTPEPGFYCLYRARPDDGSPPLPDCEGISEVAATHAAQLWGAGVDFVFTDLTNLPVFEPFADVIGLRPFEVLLEEWSALRAAGQPTPQVAAWLPVTAVSESQVPMIEPLLEVYARYASGDLLFRPDPGDAPVIFVVDHDGLPIDAALWAQIEAAGFTPVRLWGNLSAERLAAGTAGWMQPCTSGGAFTTWVRPEQPCGQGYTHDTPIGTVLSVSRSFQIGYASLPLQASGRLGGLTLQKQFETAFLVQPDVLLINAWNEHVAQPQANPLDPNLGALRQSMGVTDRSDAGADWLWVDMYGAEFNRDLEPTLEDGGAGYALLQACLSHYRTGRATCDDADNACCQLAPGMQWVYSLRAGAQGASDHVLTLDSGERDSLLSSGWTELCNPHYGPPGLCGGGQDSAGPFQLYPADGEGRVALHRCWSGSDHFLSTDPGCEGRTAESLLGYMASEASSEAPRALTRCYNEGAGVHLHALDSACPGGARAEAVLGHVR